MSKNLTKRQLRRKQKNEDKKFNRTMFISFGLVFLVSPLILLLIYWCDVRYSFRKFAFYGKEVQKNLVCMVHDRMQHHESSEIVLNNKIFYVCSHNCYVHLIDHFQDHAYNQDSITGDSICKADAVIGLKVKGEPLIIYFKNKETQNNYYKQRNKLSLNK